jgi:hypothetical protein
MIRKTVIYVASHAAIIWNFRAKVWIQWLSIPVLVSAWIAAIIGDFARRAFEWILQHAFKWILQLASDVFQRLF